MRVLAKAFAILLLAAAMLVAGFVAVNWAPDRPVSELKARWAPLPSDFVSVEGMAVHFRDEGARDDPAPIVLLHGTSASLHTWEGWSRALTANRRVIRFDLPGFGLTGPTPDGDYTIERYARFVTAMLDELGVRRCVLAGNSLGGQVAWVTALIATERVEKLILVDAAGYPLQSTSVPIGFRIARLPVLNKLAQFTLPRRVIEASLTNVYGDPRKVTPELVDLYFAMTVRAGNRQALAQRFSQIVPGALTERIPALKQPTLILWGGRDRLIPPEHGQRFQREIAGSRLIVFPDLGHVPHEEDPAGTVAAVQQFLARE